MKALILLSQTLTSADLEVQLMQLNDCDGALKSLLKYLIKAMNTTKYSNCYVKIHPSVKYLECALK